MELIKALEVLQAPANIKFNLLAFNNWKNSVDRKIKLLETLEWFNAQLKRQNTQLKIEGINLKFAKIATDSAKRHIDEVAKNLPFDDKGRLPKQQIVELCTESYAAGYYAGLAKSVEDPEETKKLREQSEALHIVEAEVTRIREYIDANKIVDANGNVLDY